MKAANRLWAIFVALIVVASVVWRPAFAQAPVFTSGPPSPGAWHVPYSFTLTAIGIPPITFNVIPAPIILPPGLSLNVATGLISGTPIYAGTFPGQFRAYNGFGPGTYQTYSIFIAPNQTINFGALPNRTLGTSPFTVSATASSGLPVTFAASTQSVCTLSGATVTLIATGTCTIRASQSGNANFSNAFDVSQSFAVTNGGAASQTITFAALSSRAFGTAPFIVVATASSGLPVTLSSLTASVCTVSGSTVTLVAVGTCSIRASQAGNSTYLPALNVDQSFSVTQPTQTITFGSLGNKVLGAAPFTVSATASSGLAVGFSSVTTAVCAVSSNSVTLVATGTCTIRASQAGNATYAPAPNVDQSFSVVQASQTITFGALGSQTLGAAPFTVSATASSGLAVTFSTLTTAVCTVSGSVVTLNTAGICTVRASQAGNANYNPAPNVDQSFAVQTAQTITFGSLGSQLLGTSPFTVSATASSGLPVSFSSQTITVCMVNGNTVALMATGTCTIRASQSGNETYAPAPNVDQSLSVTVLHYLYDNAGNLIGIQRY